MVWLSLRRGRGRKGDAEDMLVNLLRFFDERITEASCVARRRGCCPFLYLVNSTGAISNYLHVVYTYIGDIATNSREPTARSRWRRRSDSGCGHMQSRDSPATVATLFLNPPDNRSALLAPGCRRISPRKKHTRDAIREQKISKDLSVDH